MTFSFHNVIELLVSFLAIFFAGYLLTLSAKNKSSNVFMALILFLFAVNISHSFIEVYTDKLSVNLSVFIVMSIFLVAPALYLYSKSSLDFNFRLSKKDSIHLLPFILFNILLIPDIYLVNFKGDDIVVETDKMLNAIVLIGLYVHIFFYLILIYKMLWQYKRLYFENFSNTDIRKFKYLFQLNTIVTVVFITSAIKNYFIYTSEGKIIEGSIHVVLLMILLFFCWIIYKALNAPELFSKSIEDLKPVETLLKEDNIKLASTGLLINKMVPDEESDSLAIKVKNHMAEEKPYLNPALSLYDLSKQIQVPSRQLSMLINHHLKKHFFDFVNEYRINAAAHLLKDPDKKKLTVLEILYEVGFNSKSSFNTAFKKNTGFTPTAYRKASVNQ